MTQFLPPNLLALFAPRDPIPYLPPVAKLPHEKKNRGYLGVSQFLDSFEDPKDTPPPTKVETREERLERRRRERAEQVAYKLEQEIAVWDPASAPNSTSDPFKTLFVARINYDTSESKLRREFEVYGPIKKILLIHNSINGKPRGYAFIEYEHERDMHSAYKHADGKKIDGRRVLVDVERARTVKGWLPRRLGGGLGGTRRGGPDVNIKHSGREDNERERERYRLEREREERGINRERETRDRDRVREREFDRRRSRSRERRRRSRSRSPRRDKRRRSKDKIRDEITIDDDGYESRRDRDRDRDKDRKRRRSKSRDKDRDARKRERRERREKEKIERVEFIKTDEGNDMVRVKEEPVDDYEYTNYQSADFDSAKIKYEEEDEQKYEPHLDTNGRRYEDDYEEGEYNN
ncbi:U1 small nuclear ribonucleoprotein 70 kDa [Diorhabda carinulata]|uniref:U1 small nuclear ribonucleoprotein 70 kDa n=1 Tax=Diorhabda sublineata TaxID=1163346 RepID=UPI0024E0F32F|nr:U1 small nuclear ribonucleoprotein 70 kDa [Diorhabda sublineata]XP_056629731.1 U1 small nuclear ribonucleoprotein 70 kDa [Diorhabda sublineata]XP_056629732.1 U1 small nuclear ribonucleoprotein 70 kDa [Diorhabda sublineata]XP_057671624.1 U1 small nuclear ribonucleoprotein 70 kDa [Diorhabda carinulata]